MPGTGKARRRRGKRYAVNPYCTGCGVKMVLPETLLEAYNVSQVTQVPPEVLATMATTEHILSRFQRPRRRAGTYPTTTILCYACNHKRGEEEHTGIYAEEHRRRSIEGDLKWQAKSK